MNHHGCSFCSLFLSLLCVFLCETCQIASGGFVLVNAVFVHGAFIVWGLCAQIMDRQLEVKPATSQQFYACIDILVQSYDVCNCAQSVNFVSTQSWLWASMWPLNFGQKWRWGKTAVSTNNAWTTQTWTACQYHSSDMLSVFVVIVALQLSTKIH